MFHPAPYLRFLPVVLFLGLRESLISGALVQYAIVDPVLPSFLFVGLVAVGTVAEDGRLVPRQQFGLGSRIVRCRGGKVALAYDVASHIGADMSLVAEMVLAPLGGGSGIGIDLGGGRFFECCPFSLAKGPGSGLDYGGVHAGALLYQQALCVYHLQYQVEELVAKALADQGFLKAPYRGKVRDRGGIAYAGEALKA